MLTRGTVKRAVIKPLVITMSCISLSSSVCFVMKSLNIE